MLRDRIRGAWLGLAAGDRIGGPLKMALCLGNSLLERQAFNEQAILDKYLDWWRTEGFDTGLVVYKVFKHIEQGIKPNEAVLLVHQQLKGLTDGCNPMHRSLALALSPFLGETALAKAALDDAKLSHYDAIAGNCSQAFVLLTRYIIDDKSLDEAIEACKGLIPEDIFERIHHQVSPALSSGGYAPDILETSLSFVRDNRDFRMGLAASLGFAGMENFSPVIVGTIAGALYGANSIPENALHHCKILGEVETIADSFARLWE
jgi:ADP-ribosylglycohydrolase